MLSRLERTSGVPPTVSEIWDLRNAGRVVEAYDAYLSFCHQYAISPGATVQVQYLELVKNFCHADEYWDVLLLEVSFLRRRMQIESAEARIEEIKALMNDNRAGTHFGINFQMGLNAMFRGDYSKALDFFFTARSASRNHKEFHLAFLDMLLCMEDLSYDYSTQLLRFEETFTEVQEEAWASNVRGQYQTLRLRTAYRNGDDKLIEEMLTEPPMDEEGSYFLLWTLALPFVDFPGTDLHRQKHFHFLCDHLKGHLVPYRMRTIKALLLEEDFNVTTKADVWIERFYLWTWLWLTQPDETKLDKVFQLKLRLNEKLTVPLTAVGYRMLENACRWLGLFLGASDKHIKASLSHLVHPLAVEVPILEYERLLLDYCFALRDGKTSFAQDAFAVLKESPLHANAHFRLGEVVNHLGGDTSGPLSEKLQPIVRSVRDFAHDHAAEFHEGILVDVLSKRIIKYKGSKRREEVRSSSLSQLIRALLHNETLRASEVLKTCFNLSQYDSLVHDPKLANLLNRANKHCAPFLRVKRKESHIFGELVAERVWVRGNNPHTSILSQNVEFYESVLFPENKSRPLMAAKQPARSGEYHVPEGWLSRQDVQSLLGLSRTSAVRRLNEWMKQRLVVRKGIGKASKYKLSRKLGPELSASGERG